MGTPGPRIVCISHGSIVALNRLPYDLLATRHGLAVTVVVPDRWIGDSPDPYLTPQPGRGGADVVALRGRLTGNGSLFTLGGLGATIRRLRPDVVLLDEEPWSVVAAQTLASLSRAPLVFYTKQNIRKRLPPPFAQVRALTYRRSRAAWAVGATSAEVLRETGFRGLIHEVPHGVAVERFHPGIDPTERTRHGLQGVVIGFVGRLVPEKGVTDLLAALQLLAGDTRMPRFSACVVGSGPLESEITRCGSAGPLAGRVRLLTGVRHEDAPAAFRLLDVLVLPSRSTPRWREQFGRVLVEGAATGLPLVGSDSGEIPFVVRALGGGAVAAEGDVTGLAARIGDYLVDEELRRAHGGRNVAVARERFSQEAIADRMAALLLDVCR